MDALRAIAGAFAMSEETWRRHANPLSGWSRFATGLPLLALAVWSRVWIGAWALLALAAVAAWLWWNPRAFPPPVRAEGWMSRGVLGEYLYLHHRPEIAAHHRRAAGILAVLPALGALPLAAGLWLLRVDWAIMGMALAALPKLWFVDRMAWICDDWRRGGRAVLGYSEETR